MLGAGVFSLPQNMAAVASPSALLIGWAITGVGILFLAFAMLLTRIRPDLDGGGFTLRSRRIRRTDRLLLRPGILAVRGDRQCLLSGYRLFGAQFFTDTPELRLFGDGNTRQSIVGASVLLWVVHFLVLRGVQTAAGINGGHPRQASAAGRLRRARRHGAFSWIRSASISAARAGRAGMGAGQNTMLITLWVFIGVEGR